MIEMLARKIRGLVNLNLPSSFIKGNEQLVVTSNSCFSPSPSTNESSVRKISNRISSRNWGMQLKIESGTLPTPLSILPRSNVGGWIVVHLLTRGPCDCYLKKKSDVVFLWLMFCSTRYHLFIRVTFCGVNFFLIKEMLTNFCFLSSFRMFYISYSLSSRRIFKSWNESLIKVLIIR